jgi:predicted RNase H-like HicB family nuclease
MDYAYTIIVEKSENNYGAWVPDLPGCVTTGPTVEATLANMREAIEFHLEGMREDGDAIPLPSTTAFVVEVAA